MDREKPLIELWKAMTLERVWEIYAPVIVRALSRVCPSDKAEAEAEDAIVVIFHETFGQLRSGLPNLRHEVALLEWLPNVLQDIAARRRFCRCESRLFWWHLCNARFELMLSVLAERMLAAPIEEQARLREAYSKIERLHQEWLAANLPPSPEDPPGGAPAGAWPIPPKPPIAPAIQRPVWEAQLLPRNP